MADVARHLTLIKAQLLRSEYCYETFGSWWFTFEKKGKIYRLLYDGKEGELRFECDPTPEKLHGVVMTQWTEVEVHPVGDLRGGGLKQAIEEVLQEGFAKFGITLH